MSNIMRFDPFDDRFEDLMRGIFRPTQYSSNSGAVQIKVDVTEDEKAYTVHAEIPGVKKEDINVAIDGNQVSISAEVKREKEAKDGPRLLRSERYYGKVYRSFVLGQDVNDGAAEARYTDGVLELRLPKKAAQSARKLEIH
ncbi:MAG TPA: Hsp20/alpha crystallin family protein [Burkholderiales bacterium]|nr:Hsp20/alpha crystallin family protein [Burkholderiales bacterium]